MRWTLRSRRPRCAVAWFNVLPRSARAVAAAAAPGDQGAGRARTTSPRCSRWRSSRRRCRTEPWIDIPGEVLDVLRLWRPTPLVRARRLEQALGTPARIYYKDESVSPAGSHKPNTAVPQAFYNQAEGISPAHDRDRRRASGGVRWRSRRMLFGLECKVYMVRASYHQKPYRRVLMEIWGASVVPSPGRRRRAAPARSARPSVTRCATPRHAKTRTTRWDRCSTTCCCTRPSSASRPRSSWRWPASSDPTS